MSVLLCCFLGLFAIRWQGTGFGKLPHFTSASFFFPIFRQFLCLFFSFWLLIFKCSKSNLHFWRFYFALSFLFNCLYFLRVHVDLLALQTPRCDPRATMWHTPSMLGPACPQHGHPECPVKAPAYSLPFIVSPRLVCVCCQPLPPPISNSQCVCTPPFQRGWIPRKKHLSILSALRDAGGQLAGLPAEWFQPAGQGGWGARWWRFVPGGLARPSSAVWRLRATSTCGSPSRAASAGPPPWAAQPCRWRPLPDPPCPGAPVPPPPPPPPNGRAMGRWCRRAGY